MRNALRRLVEADDGQDLAEYGIALAVIVPVVAFIATAMGGDISTLWENARDAIAQALP